VPAYYRPGSTDGSCDTSRVRALGCLIVAGCGRIGFQSGELAGDAALPDGSLVAPAIEIVGLDLGAGDPVTRLSVTRLADGSHGLGFTRGQLSPMLGAIIKPDASPLGPAPSTVSPSGGGAIYTDTSIVWNGTHLLGALEASDGTTYFKTLAPDLSTFLTFDQFTGRAGNPSFARAGSTWFAGYIDGSAQVLALGGDGRPTGAPKVFPATPDSLAMIDVGERALLSMQTGATCTFSSIDANLNNATQAIDAPCTGPHAASDGQDRAFVALVGATGIEIIEVISSPGIAFAGPFPIGATGRDPRAAWGTGPRCVMWLDDGIQFAREGASGFARGAITNLPAGDPDAWDAIDDAGFAVYGSTVFRFSPCGA